MKPYQLLSVGPTGPSPLRPHPVGLPRARCGLSLLLLALCLSLVFIMPAYAGDGAIDPSFNPGAGVSQLPIMRGRHNYADGTNRFLIWGFFTSMNGVACNSLARFSSTGVLDTTFAPPISGEVRSVWLLSSGQILIAGPIIVGSGGNTYYNLARLNADGTVDTGFNHTFTASGLANTVKVQSDGKLLVGGWSLQVSEDTAATYHLLRLNGDGSVDSSYTKRSTPGGLVNGVSILSGDQARVYGTLPNISGSHTGYLTTLDNTGALVSYLGDETFDGTIYSYATQPTDGKKIYVGQFSNVLGVPRKRIARLNTDGTLDPSFDPGIGPNGRVSDIVIQTDGKIVAAGNFNTFNGNPVGYIVRLNTDGTVDPSFAVSADDRIHDFGKVNGVGPQLVAFGSFTHFNGTARPGLAYLDSSYNLLSFYSGWTSANIIPATVYALAVQPDGKVWVGGDFTGMGGKWRHGLARLNPDGTLDTTCNAGVDGYINSLALQADGMLLAGGYFGEMNGYPRTGLARLKANAAASLDIAFNPILTRQDGSVGELFQVLPLSNGQIMAAGDFYNVNGSTRTVAARFFDNGTLDTSFNAQINITSGSKFRGARVAQVSDNYVVTGYYLDGGVSNYGFLSRLINTGVPDPDFAPNSPNPNVNVLNAPVTDMVLQPDGRIIVCGMFSTINGGTSRLEVARFSGSGLLDDTNFTIMPGNPQALALQPNGKVLVGGQFSPSTGVIRLNPDGSSDLTFSQPNCGMVYSILRQATGRAFIGGAFNSYNGIARGGVARIFAGPSNFNPAIFLLLLN